MVSCRSKWSHTGVVYGTLGLIATLDWPAGSLRNALGSIMNDWFSLTSTSMPQQNASSSLSMFRPILRIPTLAIHLDRSVKEGFKFNTEIHLQPILGLSSNEAPSQSTPNTHSPSLLTALASQELVSQELCLYDLQPPCLGGAHNEFILSARLDNLCSTFCAMEGIMQASHGAHSVSMVAMFDNEEVGSLSPPGADSTFVEAVMKRIVSSLNACTEKEPTLTSSQGQGAESPPSGESNYLAIVARSLLVSADMAHAVHPNYPDMHDELHRPLVDGGLVIKYNSNNRYATNLRSSALIKRVCKTASVPFQEFMTKNDAPCGTTIGPILSAGLGMECIDVGIPQLSMHSIREMCGVKDVGHAINCFRALYSANLPELKLSND